MASTFLALCTLALSQALNIPEDWQHLVLVARILVWVAPPHQPPQRCAPGRRLHCPAELLPHLLEQPRSVAAWRQLRLRGRVQRHEAWHGARILRPHVPWVLRHEEAARLEEPSSGIQGGGGRREPLAGLLPGTQVLVLLHARGSHLEVTAQALQGASGRGPFAAGHGLLVAEEVDEALEGWAGQVGLAGDGRGLELAPGAGPVVVEHGVRSIAQC
mmetsp:Transcript_7210/g.20297  ORF Transcript_7210/g.20297 Transcript_7210/m.20297 type:complete len:216 (+) Transcript_7210:1-648(+)